MQTLLKNFLTDESGVTAIEYGLIAALIALGVSGAVIGAGVSLNQMFLNVVDCFSTPRGPGCT
jgi:pilus assembly protein Flp/PilA